ncbi:MAG: response regulator [Planctomycetota bacterium]|nr:response regulator [Planctomycetota bacterium]MDP6837427.1 response regulator [Planctomycetota bacterium]
MDSLHWHTMEQGEQPRQAAAGEDAREAVPSGECRGDLLLLDNDQRIVGLLAMFMERAGFAVRTAASFAEARLALAERQPDLLLSDLDLGQESGRVELPRLAAEGLLPPTLVVSGYLDAELEEELTALEGVRGTLPKPFDFPQLMGRVEGLLGELNREAELAVVAGGGQDSVPGDELGAASEAAQEDGWMEVVPLEPEALRPWEGTPAVSGPEGVGEEEL